ncbi:hypothetical protein [Thalassobacillus sp. C254]|uniref:hypothetical protein n=1 Tax=Thalassobacillus sp. C254 TaxID=1225341 RepID=UPI0006D19AA3|nr:hypothetical protein [Thalassobacillus sp. C254]
MENQDIKQLLNGSHTKEEVDQFVLSNQQDSIKAKEALLYQINKIQSEIADREAFLSNDAFVLLDGEEMHEWLRTKDEELNFLTTVYSRFKEL